MIAAAARARYVRVQAAMAAHGVGALLLATPHLGAFASGARRVQVAGSGGTVPWVVVPAGAPSATVFTPDPDGAPAWMPRAAVEPLCWDRGRQLARIRALVAPTAGALAVDVFAPVVQALADDLGRPLVDAAPVLAAAAAPRTTDEIRLIATALGAARAGVRAALAAATPGADVAAVLAAAASTMSAAGAGFPLREATLWRDGGAPTLAAGEPLGVRWGVYVGGHAGIATDTGAVGGDRLAAARQRWSEGLCAVASRCRAGTGTTALCEAAIAAGATWDRVLVHGLGVGLEPPFVGDGDAGVLAAGTVLVLAPIVDGFRASRALVVESAHHRWLEEAP